MKSQRLLFAFNTRCSSSMKTAYAQIEVQIGASAEVNIDTVRVEEGAVRDFLQKSGITWIFNVPHESHMGGIWERIIGVTRKVLDAVLLENKSKLLTHETLHL